MRFGCIAALRRRLAGPPTLIALGGTFTLPEDAAANDVAGAVFGKKASSVLSLVDSAGGRVALVGSNIVRGATALDYETATSHNFTVRETLAGATNTPRDTVLTLNVTNVVEDGGAPAILTAPSLTGDAIVGQRLYAAGATYSVAPDSIDQAWLFEDDTPCGGFPADNHLCDTLDQGLKVKYVETAHFGATTLTNPSALSAVIAARTLGAVNLLRTSALAAAPLTYDVTLPADCYPGDVLEAQVCANTAFGALLQQVPLTLTAALIATPANLPAAFTALGFTDPADTDIMRVVLTARLPDDTILSATSPIIGKEYVPVAVRDNFDDGVKDVTLWGADANWNCESVAGSSVAEVNGRLEIVPDGATGHMARVTANAAPFRGKFVQIERLVVTNSGIVGTELRIGPNPLQGYSVLIGGGSIVLTGREGDGGRDWSSDFIADPDYAAGTYTPPTTFVHVRLWNDYVAGVKDDMVVLTAPSTAGRPPAAGDWVEQIRTARNDVWWNGTDDCHHAICGGQTNPGADQPVILLDNYHTDAAV